MTDEKRTADRRSDDVRLAETVEELVVTVGKITKGEVEFEGRTATEIIGDHEILFKNQEDIDGKLDRVVHALEGKPILSPITGEPTGKKEKGALAKIDYFYDAVNGGEPMRWKREWTSAQRWTVGLIITVLSGILIALIPIAIAIADNPPTP